MPIAMQLAEKAHGTAPWIIIAFLGFCIVVATIDAVRRRNNRRR